MIGSIKQDFFNFKTLSPQVKFLLLFQLGVLFIVSLLVGYIFSPDRGGNIIAPPIVKQQVQVAAKGGTTLQIIPKEAVVKVGAKQTFTVELVGEPVSVTDIVLSFDPKYITISEVAKGEQFDNLIVSTIKDNRLYYSANYSPEAWPQARPGSIFTFTATALSKTEETKISVVKEETATVRDNKNTLTGSFDAIFRIYD